MQKAYRVLAVAVYNIAAAGVFHCPFICKSD